MIIRATDECWRKCRPAWFYGFLVRGVIPLQEYMRFQWWGECFRECGKILWAQNLELVDSTSGNLEAALGRHRTWLGGERTNVSSKCFHPSVFSHPGRKMDNGWWCGWQSAWTLKLMKRREKLIRKESTSESTALWIISSKHTHRETLCCCSVA